MNLNSLNKAVVQQDTIVYPISIHNDIILSG
jgi:hypothetical protein